MNFILGYRMKVRSYNSHFENIQEDVTLTYELVEFNEFFSLLKNALHRKEVSKYLKRIKKFYTEFAIFIYLRKLHLDFFDILGENVPLYCLLRTLCELEGII